MAKRKVPPPPAQPVSSSLTVQGMLTNSVTGYPLQGLAVRAYFLEPSAKAGGKRKETLLGSATSDGGGAYQIAWSDSPVVADRLCLLANCNGCQFLLRVSEGGRRPLLVTRPTAPSGANLQINLAVAIPGKKLTRIQWATLGKRLKAAQVSRLSDVVRSLVDVSPSSSAFKDWSIMDRQNALAQLESAFLDPHGVLDKVAPLPSWQQLGTPGGLMSYTRSLEQRADSPKVQQALAELSAKVTQLEDMSSVNWQVDPGQFVQGPSKAVTAFQDQYVGVSRSPAMQYILHPEMGYRDYLRSQWTNAVTLVEYIQPYQLTESQANQQLANRFHQDFTVQDNSSQVANEILIKILADILTSPTGGAFGFGLAPSKIPARGAMTAREYLDALIALTGLSAHELTLRYRTDFARPDSSMSTPVWENIHTLQGFYRDSFQSVVDPADAVPDVFAQAQPSGQPIIPDKMQGRAPFFLEYGEWLLLQQPIPFENYFQIRQVFNLDVGSDTRQQLQNFAGVKGPDQALYQLFQGALDLQDQLTKGYAYLDESEYRAALDIFNSLQASVFQLLGPSSVGSTDIPGGFSARHAMKVKSMDDLQKLLTLWNVPDRGYSTLGQWAAFYQSRLVCSLVYLAVFALPVLIAQASLGMGDYPTSVLNLGRSAWFLVGKATTSDTYAYRYYYANEWEGSWLDFPLYHAGNLPYTVDTEKLKSYPSFSDDDSAYWGAGSYTTALESLMAGLVPGLIHPVESKFFKLQMGGAMLEWADSLYRTDDDSGISRSRELYKGVYFLHGAVPPINPSWSSQQALLNPVYFSGSVNPAQASQLARAELGFTQIQAGLNFFGYSDDMVPILRYSTLKAAADTFASAAKSAEQDFLSFMGQMENATIENMKNAAMLQRAELNSQVATQQAGIAQDQVKQAQIVVSQVNAQITSVQNDIANHDSFFGQLGDFIGGMAKIATGLPSWFTSPVGASTAAEAGFSSSDTAGLLGLGAGASVMAGFVAFGVAGYMTMSSMADAQNQRAGQLATLQNQTLPSAQAQLDIAQRSASIANLQQQIAQADAQLANELLVFAQDRYLSIEFWTYMASLLERVMRQFLDLATRMGWLAQRALSYDQDTTVNIIQMDYFPPQELGAGGAEKLQLDLAQLEAEHIDGLKEMIPVKYTFSLARDFPLQFAQLVSTGQCIFQTLEAQLQLAYPGTFGYRIIAVTPLVSRIAANAPVRGLLSNAGVSRISGSDGTSSPSVRPADALPISEFNLGTTDMQIYGLPGGTLMQFEGSGVETVWKLEFPPAANQAGLGDVADVLISMDARAQFSPTLYQTQVGSMPASVSKFVMVSASKQRLSGLADLQGKPAKAAVSFDITSIGLPPQEKTRVLNNLAVLVIGAGNGSSISATVGSTTPAQKIAVTLVDGVAFSNAPPITDALSTSPLSPLNALSGMTADQTFSILIDKTKNASVDFTTVQDVIFGVDYTATY
jgi:Tc toxin complex TcA C-terminal TcB-binding domain